MKKIPFENGVRIAPAKVTIDNNEYEVTSAKYSGTTPLSAENLNQMQNNIEDAINEQTEHRYFLKVTEVIPTGGIVEMPCYYKPHTNCLVVYLNGERLLYSEDGNKNTGHYTEIEIPESENSNQIMLTNDWGISEQSIAEGRIFEFVVRR